MHADATGCAPNPPTLPNTLQEPAANGVVPFIPFEAEKVQAGSNAVPIVILPGFGNNTGDYTEPFGDKTRSLANHLEVRQGFTSSFTSKLQQLKVAQEGCMIPTFESLAH